MLEGNTAEAIKRVLCGIHVYLVGYDDRYLVAPAVPEQVDHLLGERLQCIPPLLEVCPVEGGGRVHYKEPGLLGPEHFLGLGNHAALVVEIERFEEEEQFGEPL